MEKNIRQIALVTGAGSGIGRACALKLADEGWIVVAVGRTEAKLVETKGHNPNIHVQAGDMTKSEDVEQVFLSAKSLGEITRVVHCAASFRSVAMNDVTDEQIDATADDIRMTLLVVRAAVQSSANEIVLISSFGGIPSMVLAGSALYSASKVAMLGIGMAVRQELPSTKFIIVCPAAVDTPMGNQASQQRYREDLDKSKVLQPIDVAKAMERGLAANNNSHWVFKVWQEDGAPQFESVEIA